MSTYVLDTGAILGYAKGADYAKYIDKTYSISVPPNIGVISVVTIGEMLSLAKQRDWGHVKALALHQMLNTIPTIDIHNQRIFDTYAEIDAYSQGKYTPPNLPAVSSARNMGKNDIWIAATSVVLNASLVTTDQHFNHLNGKYMTVIYIDPPGNYVAQLNP
jgi:predicted nucleic acid-binding protein